jgi:hypothetical protein
VIKIQAITATFDLTHLRFISINTYWGSVFELQELKPRVYANK